MKKKSILGICGVTAAVLAYGAYVHARNENWLEGYRATSTCAAEDDEYFLTALSRHSTGQISQDGDNRTKLLTKIASDCTVKSVEGNPLVKAFDANFSAATASERETVFADMTDPSLFFTKRVLEKDEEWGHLTSQGITEQSPILAKLSPPRQYLIAAKYQSEIREAAAAQRKIFIDAAQHLGPGLLPQHMADYATQLTRADSSLQVLATLDTLARSKSTPIESPLQSPAKALTQASEAFKSLAANESLGAYSLQQTILGSEAFVAGANGHYYFGVLPGRPEEGRIVIHAQDKASLRPGVHRYWVRQANLDEMVTSSRQAWLFTYVIADAKTEEQLNSLINSAQELSQNLQKVVFALNNAIQGTDSAASASSPDNSTSGSSLQAAYNKQMNKLSQKAAAEITEQDMGEVAEILAHPKTVADWQFLAELEKGIEEDEASGCDTGSCQIHVSMVRSGAALREKTGIHPPADVVSKQEPSQPNS